MKATNRTLVWSSSAPSVAFTDENGEITATADGTVTLRATAASGVYAEYTITVQNPENTMILPETLSCLDEEAFTGASMNYAIIPASCPEVSSRAFAGCLSLRMIRISGASTAIAEDAFDDAGLEFILAPEESLAQEYADTHQIGFIPLK